MAPNTKSSTKKGGGKKGESKTGAAVRALDDDEEDKIQVEAFRFFSLSPVSFFTLIRRSTTLTMMTFNHLSFYLCCEHHRLIGLCR